MIDGAPRGFNKAAMSEDAIALEQVCLRALPPLARANLGGWRLNAATGFMGRLNCCWPLAAPDRPVQAAIDAVEGWYAARGLKPIFKLADGAVAPEDLAERLTERGYRPRTRTLVMTGPVEGEAHGVVLAEHPDEAFRDVFLASGSSSGDARERVEALGRIPQPARFARLGEDAPGGGPLCIGACAVEDQWAGVFAMRTVAAHRRRGHARTVLAGLLGWAHEAGARRAYLQVEASNDPAIALYRAAGFETAYAYAYWDRP